jgi:hypothetical protein
VSSDDADQTTATRYDWERIVRRAQLPAPVKLVALTLATFADRDGSRVYPGVSRLVAVTCLSERSVRSALGVLRDKGLIERVYKGGHRGVNAFTDVHRLAIPVDLFEAVEMLGPDEVAAPQPAPRAAWVESQPAPGAAQPAGRAAQPAPGAVPTGTRCTPPVVSTNHQPTQLQNDESRLGTDVQNAREEFAVANVISMSGWGGRR